MENSDLFMMDPDREYAVDDLKKAMKKYNAHEDAGAIMMYRGEFMKFWREEFGKYYERTRIHSKEMMEFTVILEDLQNEK